MKKKVMSLIVMLFVFEGAYAGKASEGGEKYCMSEFTPLLEKLANDLLILGNDKVTKVAPKIDVNVIWEKARLHSCIPVLELDRSARSYPESNKVELLVEESLSISSWQELSSLEKYQLAMHELLVLSGYETDGRYFLSKILLKLLISEIGNEYKLIHLDGEEITINSDKRVVSIYKPRFKGWLILEGSQYCEFNSLKSGNIEPEVYSNDEFYLAKLLANGEYDLVYNGIYQAFIMVINCLY